MKEIETKHGKVLLDDDYYEKFISYGINMQISSGRGKKAYPYRYENDNNGKRKIIYIHREVIDAKKGEIVDHINGNKLDNRKENLRLCRYAENNLNIPIKRNNTSGYKGVQVRKHTKLFEARIGYNGKSIPIGYFKTKDEAALAYNKKAIELYGEYAKLNVVL